MSDQRQAKIEDTHRVLANWWKYPVLTSLILVGAFVVLSLSGGIPVEAMQTGFNWTLAPVLAYGGIMFLATLAVVVHKFFFTTGGK